MSFSRRTTAVLAGAAAIALVATGCSSEAPAEEDDTTPITLTVTTFGTMGVEDNFKKYEELHPNITIEATNLENGGAARDDAYAKIAAGTGLSDVVAIEEGWLSTIRDVSDAFVDLRDYGIEDKKGDWLDWKYQTGTDAEGRVFGAGLDIGPQGLCYRGDLFEAAGFPSDREGVRELLGGDDATWDKFYEVAAEYKEKTGKAFYHNASFHWNAFVNQQEEGYYKKDGTTLNIEGNAALQEQLGRIVDAANAGLSAELPAWPSPDQAANDKYATYVCPSWMLGVVKGFYPEGTTDTGWDFADVLPGGAANWGGAFVGVSEASEHKDAAAKFALWLAEPEQQASAFEKAGPFPSTLKGQELVKDSTDPFFNDAPVGALFGARSEGVIAQVKGPQDSAIQDNVFGPVLDSINQGKITDADKAWDEAMSLLKKVVK